MCRALLLGAFLPAAGYVDERLGEGAGRSSGAGGAESLGGGVHALAGTLPASAINAGIAVGALAGGWAVADYTASSWLSSAW